MIALVLIVTVALGMLVSKVIFAHFNSAIIEGDMANTETTQVLTNFETGYATMDNMMMFAIIGFTIILLITAFLIPTHPIFLFINIIGIVFMSLLAGLLGNVYAEVVNTDLISDNLAYNYSSGIAFAKTTFIMQKLPWIAVAIIVLATIITYGKGRAGN